MMKAILTALVLCMAGLRPAAAQEAWRLMSYYYGAVETGGRAVPACGDIDNDGDLDLLMGGTDGSVRLYVNDGSASAFHFSPADSAVVPAGNSYAAPFLADLDADNDLDLLVGNSDGRVRLYRNDGTPAAPVWILADAYLASLDVGSYSVPCVADLDNDGDPDLLIGNSNGTLYHYRNDGTVINPSWTQVSTYYGGIDAGSYSCPRLADIDHDGDADLFVGNYDGTMYYYRNDGTAAVPVWTLIDMSFFFIDAGYNAAPAFPDIDGDGDFDLFIGDSYGALHFYRNEGSAQAAYMASVSARYGAVGGNSGSLPALGDIDGDGDADMLVGGTGGRIMQLRNDGTASRPSWEPVTDTLPGINTGGFAFPALADIDHDGDPDLFVGREDGTIGFYRNNGTAQVPDWVLLDTVFQSIDAGSDAAPAFCDIDADGDLDLFIGNYSGTVYHYRNDGDATTPSYTLVTSSYLGIDVNYQSVPAFTDLDGDGDQELFVGGSYGYLSLYLNDGSPDSAVMVGITQNYASIDAGSNSSPAFFDLDADGDQDLLIGKAGGFLTHYRNDGAGRELYWREVTQQFLGIDAGSYAAPAFVDIDADGDRDLFVGNYNGNLAFYRNDGRAAAPACTLISGTYNGIAVGSHAAPAFVDIDGDGDQDLFVGNYDGSLAYYRNDGSAAVPAWTRVDDTYFNIDVGSNAAPAFADLDADGDFDMVCGNYSGTLYFYRNQGNAYGPYWTLGSSSYGSIDVGSHSMPAFCDIDGDGDQDLFVGEYDGNINYYVNTGGDSAASFTLETYSFNSYDVGYNSAPAFTDIDGDPNPDFFAGASSGYLWYWEALNAASGVPGAQPGPGGAAAGTAVSVSPNPCRTLDGVRISIPGVTGARVRLFDRSGRELPAAGGFNPATGTYRFGAGTGTPAGGIVIYRVITDRGEAAGTIVVR